MLLYTSGSTGRPKGAILPHRQLFYNSLATTTGWEIGASDIAPVHTPFFHTGAWHVVAMPHFHVGAAIVLFEQFDARAFLDGLVEEKCTWSFGVPTQIAMMLECDGWERALGGLRFFMVGRLFRLNEQGPVTTEDLRARDLPSTPVRRSP